MKYDVLIVGGGPSGCFSAYKINELNPLAKVLVLEMGKSLKDRKCPERELGKCVKCKICAVTHGSSGAGAFSDAKLLLPNKEDRVVRNISFKFTGGFSKIYFVKCRKQQLNCKISSWKLT